MEKRPTDIFVDICPKCDFENEYNIFDVDAISKKITCGGCNEAIYPCDLCVHRSLLEGNSSNCGGNCERNICSAIDYETESYIILQTYVPHSCFPQDILHAKDNGDYETVEGWEDKHILEFLILKNDLSQILLSFDETYVSDDILASDEESILKNFLNEWTWDSCIRIFDYAQSNNINIASSVTLRT